MKNVIYIAFFVFAVVGVGCLEPNFPLAVFFFTLAVFAFFIARYIDNHEDEPQKHSPSTQDTEPPKTSCKPDTSFTELVYLKHQLIIERFNRFFDLGLYDGDIYEIARSPSPYEELEQYVAAGTPSFEEAYLSLKKTISNLVRGIILLPEKANALEKSVFDFVDDFFKHHSAIDIFERYTLEEENCPPDCMYLVGKINYFFLSLELLATYAEENGNEELLAKCEEIIEKSRPLS